MDKRLAVLVAGKRAGTLIQKQGGGLSFLYDSGYSGPPLSLSMPVSGRRFGDKVVAPYFMGLLPDSPGVRRALGREFGVSGNSPFALLEHIGLDCPGAIQVCSEDQAVTVPLREEGLVPLSETEIAERLARGRTDENAKWETDQERWSLGGQQSKLALRYESGAWFSCTGSAATTHILKPGIPGLRSEALNEYVCLELAAGCGIPAAHVSYLLFDGEPAIVVERYDRVRDQSGAVVRLHQEDFCQALGVLPQNKYPEDGGPSAGDIIDVLKRTGRPAAGNLKAFMKMLFFNYLIAAPDAHGKNYSMVLGRDLAYLAPLYDVASMIPYASRLSDIKLAMGIAGENRVASVSARRLSRFAKSAGLERYGLDGATLSGMLAELAEALPGKLESVLSERASMPGVDELGERLLPGISHLCEKSLSRLG